MASTPALVGERLADVLQCFPAAAIRGVQWVTLVRKYEDRYETKLDLGVLGYDSALTAASTMLWDVVRIVQSDDRDNPVLAIEDAVALTPRPTFLATWPSMYRSLNEIVQNNGAADKAEDDNGSSSTRTLLLSKLKPLLQRHWHNNFDDCGLFYYTEEGSMVKLKKMKHLLQALFRWRADRVALRDPLKLPASKLSGIDATVKLQLDIVPSKSHNDLLLRCFSPQAITHSNINEDSIHQPDVISKQQFHEKFPRDTLSSRDSESDTQSADSLDRVSNVSSVSCNADMQHEIERLRAENAQLRAENDATMISKLFDTPQIMPQSESLMENVFDNPFEPPPEMPSVWTPSPSSSASTRFTGFCIGSGSVTPLTDMSMSGSCTPVPHSDSFDPSMGQLGKGMTFMPVWFPMALGDRVQIPSGVVQQARAVFERHASIPSYFSQQMIAMRHP